MLPNFRLDIKVKPLFIKLIHLVLLLFFLPGLIWGQSIKTKVLPPEKEWLEKPPLHNKVVNDMLEDSNGFLWFATKDGLYKFDGATYTAYEHDPSESNTLGSTGPNRLLEDRNGKIWMGVDNGISVFDPETEVFTNYNGLPVEQGIKSFNSVLRLVEDKNGVIWIATDRGLCNYNPEMDTFTFFSDFPGWIPDIALENDSILWVLVKKNPIKLNVNNNTYSEFYIYDETGKPVSEPWQRLLIVDQENIWMHTYSRHLYKMVNDDPSKSEGNVFRRIEKMDGKRILELSASRDGNIWMMGPNGILYYDNLEDDVYAIAFEGFSKVKKLQHFSFLEDSRSYYWAGFSGGIVKWKKSIQTPMTFYDNVAGEIKSYKWGGIPVIRFETWDENKILIGTVVGVKALDLSEGTISPASPAIFPESALDTLLITCFFKGKQSDIWIGAWDILKFRSTLVRIDRNTLERKIINMGTLRVGTMAEAGDGTFWIGTMGGIFHYDLDEGILKRYKHRPDDSNSLSDNDITALVFQNDSVLWIGTNGGGLNRLNINSEQFTRYTFDHDDPASLSNKVVSDIHIDEKGVLWVATWGGGLCKWNENGEGFERFLKNSGLNTLRISAIEEDEMGQIWVGTSYGVSKLDKYATLFHNYGDNDGQNFFVRMGSSLKDDNGFLYYGASNAFVKFHPESLKTDSIIPKLVMTAFYLNNKLVLPHQEKSPLEKSITYTKTLNLKHNQNFIGFNFAAQNFIQPHKNQYAYKMEGLIEEWQYIGNRHEVSFTDLDPGKYVLHIKGTNQEGVWNEKGIQLKISIDAPWWATRWAYLAYILIFGWLLFVVRRYELKRQLAKAEAIRFKELDETKSRLYTNITHEFRTPLTIILGMAEQMDNDPRNWFREGLLLIKRNGKHLLVLVNQLLDLSKLESGNMQVNLIKDDIVGFLEYLVESFHSYADSKDVRLHFDSDFKAFEMDYDPEKIQNIVSNLLSNAIKFTPAGGDVYLDVREKAKIVPQNKQARHSHKTDNKGFTFIVRDNGSGIAREHLPFIFDRFYQVDASSTRRGEGTGVGLSLVKELVKLLGGDIKVESELNIGTRFLVFLPVTKTADSQLEGHQPEKELLIAESVFTRNEMDRDFSANQTRDVPVVLLIEDNMDVITYLASFLSADYKIETAVNGQIGIEKALEITPDLIVSDVMMPEKDGFEVCEFLKKDERTSHIPIVLLTAKTHHRDKIEGLNYGADAYLTKPFHKEELLVRMENLIEQRLRQQKYFEKNSSLKPLVNAFPKNEESQFLKKVVNIVENHMGDENFGMPVLCKTLNMSRSNLFRKLKALTGKSATHLIRIIRLEKARELLVTSEMSISEVAFEVGFTSSSYFSKMFMETYNISPREFRNAKEGI